MRKLRNLILTLAALFLLAGAAWADSTVVTSMETECTVAEDGSCVMTIRASVNFDAGTEGFVIPVSPSARELNVTGAQYRLERGGEYNRLVLLGSYSGPTELTVTYHLAETVIDRGSEQTFSVTLLYPAWPCAIQQYRVQLHLPGPFDSLPTILSGYYGDLIDNYMEITIRDGDLEAVLNSKQTLQDHEAMSLSLELPGDYFDLRFLAGKTVKIDRLIFLLFLALSGVYWVVFLRGKLPLPKRQVMPPVGCNAGEIPFVLTGQKPDLALMVVQWASLGYLTIHRSRKGRVHLSLQIDMGNERKPYEIELFRTLFARGEVCDLRSREYSKAREMAVSRTTDYWQKRIFSRGGSPVLLRVLAVLAGLALSLACFDQIIAPKSWRWFAIVPLTLAGGLACQLIQSLGGCMLRRHSVRSLALALAGLVFLLVLGKRSGFGKLMLPCILFQLLVGLLLRCGGRRTKSGSVLASELLGYRRYLLSTPSASIRGNLRSDPQYFYRSLPYADALQVGRLFSTSFDRTRLEPCDWLDWEGNPAKTAPGFYDRYIRLMAALRGEREPLLIRWKHIRAKRRAASRQIRRTDRREP